MEESSGAVMALRPRMMVRKGGAQDGGGVVVLELGGGVRDAPRLRGVKAVQVRVLLGQPLELFPGQDQHQGVFHRDDVVARLGFADQGGITEGAAGLHPVEQQVVGADDVDRPGADDVELVVAGSAGDHGVATADVAHGHLLRQPVEHVVGQPAEGFAGRDEGADLVQFNAHGPSVTKAGARAQGDFTGRRRTRGADRPRCRSAPA